MNSGAHRKETESTRRTSALLFACRRHSYVFQLALMLKWSRKRSLTVIKHVSQLRSPRNSCSCGLFSRMILLLCLSFSSYLRVTLSLWVMLGIWRPASRHCLSKITMHPLSHLAFYRDNATEPVNPTAGLLWDRNTLWLWKTHKERLMYFLNMCARDYTTGVGNCI